MAPILLPFDFASAAEGFHHPDVGDGALDLAPEQPNGVASGFPFGRVLTTQHADPDVHVDAQALDKAVYVGHEVVVLLVGQDGQQIFGSVVFELAEQFRIDGSPSAVDEEPVG